MSRLRRSCLLACDGHGLGKHGAEVLGVFRFPVRSLGGQYGAGLVGSASVGTGFTTSLQDFRHFADDIDGIILDIIDGDKKFRVINLECKFLCFRVDGFFQGNLKMEGELVVAPDLAEVGDLANFLLFAVRPHDGEIFIVFERRDLFLGEGGQFALAVNAVAIDIQAVQRHLRIGVVKGPFEVDALDQAVLGKHHIGLHLNPDVGVRPGPGARKWGHHCSHDNIKVAARRHP